MKESPTVKEILTRKCVHLLDVIYSTFDCTPFIKTLQKIETNLFNDFYETQESFIVDLLQIPSITEEYIDSVKNNSNSNTPIVEEYCHLPIYSSIHIRNDSLLYVVNIKSLKDLHYSFLESTLSNESKSPIHRLFIRRKSNLLMETKETANSVLALFFNAQIERIEDSDELYRIRSLVLAVHPLGEFQPSEVEDVEGWIKVKLIKYKTIDTVISNRVTSKLFDGYSEVVRKLPMKPNTKLKYARENEMRQYFLHTIMSSNYSNFEYYHKIPSSRITMKSSITIKDYTPDHKQQPTNNTEDTTLLSTTANHWKKLEGFTKEKKCAVVYKEEYDEILTKHVDAQGYFKQVFFIEKDVVQIFQKSTSSQRVTEIACLLKLRHHKHIGQIQEVIFSDIGGEVIGLTMDRYEMTLKEYLKFMSHRRLSNYQRMDIILQMIKSLKAIHDNGIAHRDLSTVNFMVDIRKDQAPLDDGSTKIDLYLIDFGKSIFGEPKDAERWWVSKNEQDIYEDEVKPRTKEELIIWCKNLPYIMARPDHGYRFYRSIQTLPRTAKDHDYLPQLINPFAEDIYSLGTLVWKIFSGVEPWPGIFDTDYKKLREAVSSDYMIDHMLDREVSGAMSKKLLRKFLRADPEQRQRITEILDWMLQPHIIESLLDEWDTQETPKNIPNLPTVRTFDEIQEEEENNRRGRPKGSLNKRTVLKMRMGEVGKTRANKPQIVEQEEPRAPRPRGRPKGSVKKTTTTTLPKKKNPVGRPRKRPA